MGPPICGQLFEVAIHPFSHIAKPPVLVYWFNQEPLSFVLSYFISFALNSMENKITKLLGKIIGIDIFAEGDPRQANLFNAAEDSMPEQSGRQVVANFPVADALVNNL